MKELKVSEVFANAMSVYKSRFWFFVGATLFAALLAILGGALFVFVLGMALLVTYLLTTAQDRFYLRSCRGENVKLVSLFDTAKDLKSVKRVFCARGWADLWILIWGLIPVAGIVFAIIRYYEYSFVTYLISDREDLSATELKEESKRLTQGYKGNVPYRLFVLACGRRDSRHSVVVRTYSLRRVCVYGDCDVVRCRVHRVYSAASSYHSRGNISFVD